MMRVLQDDGLPSREWAGGCGLLTTERGRLPLMAMEVSADISGLVYSATIAQTFMNASDEAIEATYIFPLPERAGVTAFRMEVAGRVVTGEIKERGQARRDYDAAIQAGQRAAIAEEDRSGVFTLRVGNLLPREQAVVRLTLSGPVSFDCGEATFRFPLVVAPRYIPGNVLGGANAGVGTQLDTDAVPDASRISPPVLVPGFPNPVQLSLRVRFESSFDITDVRSSLHSVEEDAAHGRAFRLLPGERLDRDFILRYRIPAPSGRSQLTLVPDAPGADAGTFLLSLIPPEGTTPKARDVVCLLDRSGSMGGWKMVAARRAVARIIDSLRAQDRFLLMTFDDQIESPEGLSALAPATDRDRFRAVEYLARVEARGGTEMHRPLVEAARALRSSTRERSIVLVTDGQVGNEDQLLRDLEPELATTRIFSVGIDSAVNAGLLNRLASLSAGAVELVESEDRLDAVMSSIHRRIAAPVLADVRLEAEGLTLEGVAPSRLPDLFAGAQSLIGGRYRGAGGTIVVSGRESSGERTRWTASRETLAVPAGRRSGMSEAIVSTWARARVRDCEDRFLCAPQEERAAIEREIVETSLRYSVLCRFTAFVAIDHERVATHGPTHSVVQPVESPFGWAAAPPPPPSPGVGARAVNARAPAPMATFGNAPTRRREQATMKDKAARPTPPAASAGILPEGSKAAPQQGRSQPALAITGRATLIEEVRRRFEVELRAGRFAEAHVVLDTFLRKGLTVLDDREAQGIKELMNLRDEMAAALATVQSQGTARAAEIGDRVLDALAALALPTTSGREFWKAP